MKVNLIALLFCEILFNACPVQAIPLIVDHVPDDVDFAYPSWDKNTLFDSEKEHRMEGVGNLAQDYELEHIPPYIDELDHDDYEEYDLDYLLEFSQKPLSAREFALNDAQRQEAQDIHNMYRMNTTGPLPQASDMDFIEYDLLMEWTADMWADNCVYDHGRPESNITEDYQQNLYRGPSPLISRATYLWYMEWVFWNFDNESCPGEGPPGADIQCGHYMVVMWSETNKVGCSTSFCYPRLGSHLTVCHYFPPGNRRGPATELFTHWHYGLPCSRCQSWPALKRLGECLCWKTLCVTKELCAKHKLEGCECKLKCKNCGVLDPERCVCKCKDGWDRSSCSEPCRNDVPILKFPDYCEAFSRNTICPFPGYDYVVKFFYCRKFCGACKAINPKDVSNTCCKMKMCNLGYELDGDCNCVPICPGPVCKFGIPPAITEESTVGFPTTALTTQKKLMTTTTAKTTTSITIYTTTSGNNSIHSFIILYLYSIPFCKIFVITLILLNF